MSLALARKTWGGRRATWAPNIVRRVVTLAGVDPVARDTVSIIDRVSNRGMNGQTGTIRIGNTGAIGSRRYTGAVAPMALPPVVGTSTNGRGSPNVVLPATGGAVVAAGSVIASLSRFPPVAR